MIDTRAGREGDEIRRRRECLECGRRFTTRERIELVLPKIIKRDERREDYQREKLLAGIERACEKRSVSVEEIERLVDRIERRLQESGETEVPHRRVGEQVMEELTSLDPIAAVRFASVFLDFQSSDDYAAFFRGLPEPGAPREHPAPPVRLQQGADEDQADEDAP